MTAFGRAGVTVGTASPEWQLGRLSPEWQLGRLSPEWWGAPA